MQALQVSLNTKKMVSSTDLTTFPSKMLLMFFPTEALLSQGNRPRESFSLRGELFEGSLLASENRFGSLLCVQGKDFSGKKACVFFDTTLTLDKSSEQLGQKTCESSAVFRSGKTTKNIDLDFTRLT